MEIQFQQQKQIQINKTSKFKGRSKAENNNNNNSKFVGVRQRPSGRWVAEIKDTTQKIRMWLGTFETAVEAARAYDEAACLLRGANTRTNFVTHVSMDSPLASRIRNLLNKKEGKQQQQQQSEESIEVSTPPVSTISSTSTSCMSSISEEDNSHYGESTQDTRLFEEDAYKPDLSNCTAEFESDDLSWGLGNGFNKFSFTQEVLDFPKDVLFPETSDDLQEFSEFDRMKVERQISASLYAMNGVQEYMDNIHDPTEALVWDLPPLCSNFS